MTRPLPFRTLNPITRAMIERFDLRLARLTKPHKTEYELQVFLHRCRYLCVQMPPEIRHASGDWLRTQGLNAYGDIPLLPEGELP